MEELFVAALCGQSRLGDLLQVAPGSEIVGGSIPPGVRCPLATLGTGSEELVIAPQRSYLEE